MAGDFALPTHTTTTQKGGWPVADEPSVMGLLQHWLARIESKLDHLGGALEAKADRTELTELRQELRHEAGRIDALEREVEHRNRAENEAVEERRYKVPLQLTLALVILGILTLAATVVPLMKKG